MTSARALVRATRPRQWSKNILVVTAPFAAGIAFQPQAVLEVGVAVLAFILASSGVYLANDTFDVEVDRAHPTKRFRPVAAGDLSKREAATAAIVLLGAGLATSALVDWQLLVVVGLYEAIQLVYGLAVQRVPVVELVSVASGFLLRAIAGGVATGVLLSPWFLVTVGFGSLFVVAGKRASELRLAQDATVAIRPVLALYTPAYLRFVWTLSAGVLVTTYGLWTTTVGQEAPDPWSLLSIIPVVVAVLWYARKVDVGAASQPEDALLGDGVMLLLVGIWAVCFSGAAYF